MAVPTNRTRGAGQERRVDARDGAHHQQVDVRQVGVRDLAAVLQPHLAERAERVAGERDVLVGEDDGPGHGAFAGLGAVTNASSAS